MRYPASAIIRRIEKEIQPGVVISEDIKQYIQPQKPPNIAVALFKNPALYINIILLFVACVIIIVFYLTPGLRVARDRQAVDERFESATEQFADDSLKSRLFAIEVINYTETAYVDNTVMVTIPDIVNVTPILDAISDVDGIFEIQYVDNVLKILLLECSL